MRIQLTNDNINYPLGYFKRTRPWAQVIKLEGVRAGYNLDPTADIKNLVYRTITPMKIKVFVTLEVTTNRIRQKKNTNHRINLSWDNTRKIIPKLTKEIDFTATLELPDDKPDIYKVKKVIPHIISMSGHTMHNRIALRGEVNIEVKYQLKK